MHLGAATGVDECLSDVFALFEPVFVLVAALVFSWTVEADFAKTTTPRIIATAR